MSMINLLGYLEPHMLPRDIETWLHRSLKHMFRREFTGEGWVNSSETLWNAGLKAWNERCEAHGLTLRSCDTERQTDVDTKLEAVRGPPTCRRHSAMTLTQPLALVYSDLPETVACSSISSRRLRTTYPECGTHVKRGVYFTCSECNLAS